VAKTSQLTVALPAELEAFVQERVASGRFGTASEVVQEGLRLLEVREHEREAVLQDLRREISVGLEQARSGQLRDGEIVFAELESESSSQ
jgi:antitoxin ParD1/3/4